jgi:hypothetical protein
MATSARTSATSAGAIGCTSSGAIVALPSRSVQVVTISAKSWKCVGRDDAPRHRASLDELLLRPLAGVMGVTGNPREAGDRQQHMVLNPRLPLGFEQVASRTAEERDCLVAVGRCAAARVDDGIDACQRLDQPFTGVHVDAWVRLIATVS